ncbi:MAG: hypothetical protein K9G33_10595 [Sneathiella sp.]|nr:hypothetical protein [Sneathiella sp.]
MPSTARREGAFVHGPKPDGQSGQFLLRLDDREARARLEQAAAEKRRAERSSVSRWRGLL